MRVPTNVHLLPTKRSTRVSTEVPKKVSTKAVSFHVSCFHMFCFIAQKKKTRFRPLPENKEKFAPNTIFESLFHFFGFSYVLGADRETSILPCSVPPSSSGQRPETSCACGRSRKFRVAPYPSLALRHRWPSRGLPNKQKKTRKRVENEPLKNPNKAWRTVLFDSFSSFFCLTLGPRGPAKPLSEFFGVFFIERGLFDPCRRH